MQFEGSFRHKAFDIIDPDARIRRDGDMMDFVLDSKNRFQTIPKDTKVNITKVKVVETGSRNSIVFGYATSVDGALVYGWTSTRNLRGKFKNETIRLVEAEPGVGRFGPNAAWSDGDYIGQLKLVAIVGSKLEIEHLALSTIQPYLDLVAAAAQNRIELVLNSGFRSYPEQKYLYEGFIRKLPGFNAAAKPGFSKHQNGIAFDISVSGGDGNPTYEWLKRNATAFGFVRTVSKEPWHWEFDQPKAQAALAAGTFKTTTVTA